MITVPIRVIPFLGLSILCFVACGGVTSSTAGRAECNGELDSRETVIDDLYDGDADGYFDGANPQCQEVYAVELLDCNDNNAEVHPTHAELTCNNIDDDCDSGTVDLVDADGDSHSACADDCADENALVHPGLGELACDGLDNDCNLATADSTDLDLDTWSDCDDCVDTNAAIHPGQPELICDGADNDCLAETIDGQDVDQDGSSDCFDCDDNDPDRRPGLPEICEDGLDQNCDGSDETCAAPTWEGTWSTNTVAYTCGGGNVDIDFDTVSIQDNTPDLTFIFVGSSHPGAMTGTIDGSNVFSAQSTYLGSCSKSFTLNGSFLGANSFSATLNASFSGCAGCNNQTYTVTGTR